MAILENIHTFIDKTKEYDEIRTHFDTAIIDAKKQLGQIPLYFRHFSRHDETHSQKIIQYIEMLFDKEEIDSLSMG